MDTGSTSLVPAEDLPDTIVPAEDLPGATQPKPLSTLPVTDSRNPNFVYSPTSGLTGWRSILSGDTDAAAGKFLTDKWLGAKQIAANLFGSPEQQGALNQEAAQKRSLDAPLQATAGGKAGQAIMAAPLAFLPGANTALGATAFGAGLGALDPTTGKESRAVNTGVGGALGLGSQLFGGALGRWAVGRSAEPFMGYNPAANSRLAAEAVGSSAPKLNQAAIGARDLEMGRVFNAARSPNVVAPMPASAGVVDGIRADLDDSLESQFLGNKAVQDFIGHATSPVRSASTEELGSISSRLSAASGRAYDQQGGAELGAAYKALRDHTEDLIQGTIKDPAQAAEYATTRRQFAILNDLRYRPNILKASTGEVNATNLGNYLQSNYKPFSAGTNQSPLYQMGAWGQATGEGRGAPPIDLAKNLGAPWLAYKLANNAPARFLGGATSRAVAPIGNRLGPISQGLLGIQSPIAGRVRGLLTADASE